MHPLIRKYLNDYRISTRDKGAYLIVPENSPNFFLKQVVNTNLTGYAKYKVELNDVKYKE
jgi:hypothetical protein